MSELTPKTKVICQEDDWHNAFGAVDHPLSKGLRLTISDTKYVGGLQFLQFKDIDKENWYLSAGFQPLRRYN